MKMAMTLIATHRLLRPRQPSVVSWRFRIWLGLSWLVSPSVSIHTAPSYTLRTDSPFPLSCLDSPSAPLPRPTFFGNPRARQPAVQVLAGRFDGGAVPAAPAASASSRGGRKRPGGSIVDQTVGDPFVRRQQGPNLPLHTWNREQLLQEVTKRREKEKELLAVAATARWKALRLMRDANLALDEANGLVDNFRGARQKRKEAEDAATARGVLNGKHPFPYLCIYVRLYIYACIYVRIHTSSFSFNHDTYIHHFINLSADADSPVRPPGYQPIASPLHIPRFLGKSMT
eukprot:GHVU01032921.1.p1 GENE.GHVU01032921.1~~GHVU01032921.1.p1  ORF type:complete len:287 (+),score=9.44 GHVU01032921.1:357-1217(+)